MMRHLVRGAAALLLIALAIVTVNLEEIRFVLAGGAVLCLVELGLALRTRRQGAQIASDRCRISAAQVACTEDDGRIAVRMTGDFRANGRPSYVLLSRSLGDGGQCIAPYLELSDQRCAFQGEIQEAYLSPGSLRLALAPRANALLGAPQVSVTLPAGTDQRRLERALGKILRGVPFTSDRSLPEDCAEGPAVRQPG